MGRRSRTGKRRTTASAVVERATELRARYQVRTPDALHLATAIESSAVAFLTGDAALKRCTELNIQVIAP